MFSKLIPDRAAGSIGAVEVHDQHDPTMPRDSEFLTPLTPSETILEAIPFRDAVREAQQSGTTEMMAFCWDFDSFFWNHMLRSDQYQQAKTHAHFIFPAPLHRWVQKNYGCAGQLSAYLACSLPTFPSACTRARYFCLALSRL